MEYITLSRTNGITAKGSPYVSLKVANEEETLNIAVWDVATNQGPQVGQLVSFLTIRDNQGKKSAGFNDMMVRQMATPEHPLYHLIPRPTPREEWDATMQKLISYCTDATLRSIIEEWGDKLYAKYLPFPAATTMHHAFPGGLVTHTWQMLHMLEGLYPCLPYPVKVERCILGILFHDYGKQREYETDGTAREDMFLLGHIYMSAMTLQAILLKAGVEEAEIKRIVHCVLAHHGEREYGSPVTPCLQEAVIINYLDNLSAKIDAWEGTGNMEKCFVLGTNVIKG